MLIPAQGQVEKQQSSLPSPAPENLTTPASIFPVPSGPFAIGRFGLELTDSARPDAFSADPSVHRNLMVYLWYPARPHTKGRKAPYLPGAKEMDAISEIHQQGEENFGPGWALAVSGSLVA